MWKYLQALVNLYLYSSLHIAICAGLLGVETYLILREEINLPVVLCLAFGTLSIYSLHRIVGINKTIAFSDQGRFKIIKKFARHLKVYFILSSIAFLYFFFQLEHRQIFLICAAFLPTLLYVLPVFPKGKRLRDYPFIKIFIIAFVWSYLTIVVPVSGYLNVLLWLLAIERILFFLAITIPFDIRDMEVDGDTGVPTLIHRLGILRSKQLAVLFLILCSILISILWSNHMIDIEYLIALFSTYFISTILIILSKPGLHDWFYSGLIDGTIGIRMILYSLLLLI